MMDLTDVIERLVRIESKTDDLSKSVEEHHNRMYTTLYGNGQPGLVKEVDRLSQMDKFRYWVLGIALTGLFSGIGEFAWHILGR